MATLVPALSTAALSYVRARSALDETLRGELRGVGSQTARELDLWLKERLYDLRIFVGSFEVIENVDRLRRVEDPESVARLSDYLNGVQQRFPEYAGLAVLDDGGAEVARGEAAARHPALPTDWSTALAAGEAQVGRPYWHEGLETVATTLAVPIVDADARYLGTLVATITFAPIRDLLAELSPGEDGSIEILSADGRVIVSDPPQGGFEVALTDDTRERLAADARSTVEYVADGEEHLATLIPIPSVGWSVLTRLPAREAYAQVTRLTRSTILLSSILLVVVGGAAWTIGLLITRPLARLTEAAGAVAAGDLSVDLPVTGRDEVGYLTEVFNGMVTRLRANAEALDEANATLRSQNRNLAYLSMTDELTGLHNRRYVMEVLDREVSRADRYERSVGLLMLDVDRFKDYNDRFGHQAGDDVLAAMGGVLRDATRDTDVPARYGGEEFIVVLSDTDIAGALEAGERIRERLGHEVFEGRTVTVSIGAAAYPTHGDVPTDLIAAADLALYAAKQAGRDRVVAAEER